MTNLVPHAAIEAALQAGPHKYDEYAPHRDLGPDWFEEEIEPALFAAQPHLIRAWIEGLSDAQAHELGMTMANAMYQTPEWSAKLIRSSLLKLAEPKEP